MTDDLGIIFAFVIGIPLAIAFGWMLATLNASSYNVPTFYIPKYENVEEIVWTDWSGKERKIIIHRTVK